MTIGAGYDRARFTHHVADQDELVQQLNALNDAGIDFRLPGLDAGGQPFLVMLDGPYAESVKVVVGSPWDSEVDWGTGRRCEDCNAANLHEIEHIAFPAVVLGVLVPTTRT